MGKINSKRKRERIKSKGEKRKKNCEEEEVKRRDVKLGEWKALVIVIIAP